MRRVGIDTNVILRLVVDDDEEQRRLVTAFGSGLNKEYRGLITLVALLEADWALRSQFGFTRRQSSEALRRLTHIRGVDVESHDAVVRALLTVDEANADFAGALIAERSVELGCEKTVTLDRKAANKVPSMELLS
jgi:predicted nucleic-acid-binding protein